MSTLASLASSIDSLLNDTRGDAVLTRLSPEDDSPGQRLAFQYFPETISISKAVNTPSQDVIGGSLPLYQWVSSGENVLSFTSRFSTDVDFIAKSPPLIQDVYERVKAAGLVRRNPDIRTALVFLSSFMLPTYGGESDTGSALTYAPSRALLTMPGSGIGLYGGFQRDGNPLPDSFLGIMQQCEITIDAFFPSGLPRLATVQLSFARTAQIGGYISFPQAHPAPLSGVGVGVGGTFAYAIVPRKGKSVR